MFIKVADALDVVGNVGVAWMVCLMALDATAKLTMSIGL